MVHVVPSVTGYLGAELLGLGVGDGAALQPATPRKPPFSGLKVLVITEIALGPAASGGFPVVPWVPRSPGGLASVRKKA